MQKEISHYRIEKDSMGFINVPSDCLWGAQTQRAIKHFNISNEKIPFELIIALAQIKRAAAEVNCNLGLLNQEYSKSIIAATDKIISGKYTKEFPLSIWQSGSGTQTNMNMNEVIANLANKLFKDKLKKLGLIHPNDHVNKSQSSNDVFSSAMHIASVIMINKYLIPNIIMLKNTLMNKSITYNNIIKVGRTHLQDATPLTLGQEISAWVSMLDNNLINIKHHISFLYELSLGGTAVGTGLNAHSDYAALIVQFLSSYTGYTFTTVSNTFEALSTCDAIVRMHGALKGLAVSIMKIANDIRWLSSGPRCGIGELIIPANEPGSSIMPGKVNPTQCESLIMICSQVIGNDLAISIGGSSGNFELNVCRPMIIYNFLQSIRILSDGILSFHNYCILDIKPNYIRINQLLNNSLMLVSILNLHIGYDKASEIVQKAYNENLTLKEATLKSGYINEEEFDKLVRPENMLYPTKLTNKNIG